MKQSSITTLLFSLFLLGFVACSSETDNDPSESSTESNEQGLSNFELEHGIGPVTERLELGEIDPELVSKGRNIFEMKCEMCHNMEGRMVGPQLGDVLERRSPEFVMNMILNPGEMTKKHPEGQKLLQEYMTAMPFQNVSEEDARSIVEYLRDNANNN